MTNIHNKNKKMERQNKFRGYSEQLKCFVYGFFQEIESEGVKYSYIFWQGNATPVRSDSVGQFTGVLDSKGAEIYEGDILTLRHRTFWDYEKEDIGRHEDVVYVKCESLINTKCYYLAGDNLWDNGCSYSNWKDDWYEEQKYVEVIGNIHDKSFDN